MTSNFNIWKSVKSNKGNTIKKLVHRRNTIFYKNQNQSKVALLSIAWEKDAWMGSTEDASENFFCQNLL